MCCVANLRYNMLLIYRQFDLGDAFHIVQRPSLAALLQSVS